MIPHITQMNQNQRRHTLLAAFEAVDDARALFARAVERTFRATPDDVAAADQAEAAARDAYRIAVERKDALLAPFRAADDLSQESAPVDQACMPIDPRATGERLMKDMDIDE